MSSRDEIIGAKVRAARERAGLSRAALSTAMSDSASPMHQQTIQRIEGGNRALQVAELHDLAGVLGCDPMSLSPYDSPDKDAEITRARGSVLALQRRTQELAAAVAAWTTANAEARAHVREAKRSASGPDLPEVIAALTNDREAAQTQAVSIITNAQKAVSK